MRRRLRKFSRKFVQKHLFRSPFARRGAFGKSRATRCQNSSLLRCLATPKTSKNQFEKKLFFFLISEINFLLFSKATGSLVERQWAVCSKGHQLDRIRTIVIYGLSYKGLNFFKELAKMSLELLGLLLKLLLLQLHVSITEFWGGASRHRRSS